MLIDTDMDKNETIYTDFDFEQKAPIVENDLVDNPVRQSRVWGNYDAKPIAQINWENSVANELDKIAIDDMADLRVAQMDKIGRNFRDQCFSHLFD